MAHAGPLTGPPPAEPAWLDAALRAAARAAGAGFNSRCVHGEAALRNMRTGPGGEVALMDWEDVSAAPGILDLAWMLLSSVDPARWDEVMAGYGGSRGLADVLPVVTVQGLLSLSGTPARSAEAASWMGRLQAACDRLTAAR